MQITLLQLRQNQDVITGGECVFGGGGRPILHKGPDQTTRAYWCAYSR